MKFRFLDIFFIFLLPSASLPSIYHLCGWYLGTDQGRRNTADCGTSQARLRKSPSMSDSSTLAISICWYTRASTPIAPTSSGRRSATSSPPHADAVKQSIVRHTLELGLRRYSREELEAAKAFGGKLHIQVVGLATIAEDVTPELALATIEFNHRPWRSSRQQSSQGSAL